MNSNSTCKCQCNMLHSAQYSIHNMLQIYCDTIYRTQNTRVQCSVDTQCTVQATFLQAPIRNQSLDFYFNWFIQSMLLKFLKAFILQVLRKEKNPYLKQVDHYQIRMKKTRLVIVHKIDIMLTFDLFDTSFFHDKILISILSILSANVLPGCKV